MVILMAVVSMFIIVNILLGNDQESECIIIKHLIGLHFRVQNALDSIELFRKMVVCSYTSLRVISYLVQSVEMDIQ